MDTTEGYVDTNWSLHVQNISFVPIWLAGSRILRGPKHVFFDRNGTNDHEQPRSVPLVPMLSCSLPIGPLSFFIIFPFVTDRVRRILECVFLSCLSYLV